MSDIEHLIDWLERFESDEKNFEERSYTLLQTNSRQKEEYECQQSYERVPKRTQNIQNIDSLQTKLSPQNLYDDSSQLKNDYIDPRYI